MCSVALGGEELHRVVVLPPRAEAPLSLLPVVRVWSEARA